MYEKNERVAIFGNYKYGILGYIAVGALNVGSISLSFAKDITTNNYNKQLHTNNIHRYNNLQLKKGDELGRFNLGSTIVMIFEAPKSFKFTKKTNDIVRYGDILGVVE